MAEENVVRIDEAREPAPAAPPPLFEVQVDGSVKVRLNKPVRALDQTLSEIIFREPNGLDLDLIGDPFPMHEGKNGFVTHVDWSKLIEMLARLANIPAGSVRSMKSRDLEACRWGVYHFFQPGGPTQSDQSTTP